MTMKPIRSHKSSNSGAGGLWEVRMPLHPIVLQHLKLSFKCPDVDCSAQGTQIVMVAYTVYLHGFPVQGKP